MWFISIGYTVSFWCPSLCLLMRPTSTLLTAKLLSYKKNKQTRFKLSKEVLFFYAIFGQKLLFFYFCRAVFLFKSHLSNLFPQLVHYQVINKLFNYFLRIIIFLVIKLKNFIFFKFFFLFVFVLFLFFLFVCLLVWFLFNKKLKEKNKDRLCIQLIECHDFMIFAYWYSIS